MKKEELYIIVVEDQHESMIITEHLLRRELPHATIEGVIYGRSLFQLSEQAVPHLILLDLQIPSEDGYEVLRQIRAHPRLSQVRVIAVTSNIVPSNIKQAVEAGFDGFIGKPLKYDQFGSQIRQVLAGEAVWDPPPP